MITLPLQRKYYEQTPNEHYANQNHCHEKKDITDFEHNHDERYFKKGVDEIGKILSGAGTPNNQTGSSGDLYVDSLNKVLYRKPTNEYWETLCSLLGPQGAQGPQGAPGIQGLTGARGPQGIQGEQGPRGFQGDRGEKGDKGDTGDAFTYDQFTPTQLENLRGPQGAQGIQGVQGPTGTPFRITKTYNAISAMYMDKANIPINDFVCITVDDVNNPINARLYIRDESTAGYAYVTDMSGAAGVQGPIGPQGIQGIQGEPGIQGPVGPRGLPGIVQQEEAPTDPDICVWVDPNEETEGTIDGHYIRNISQATYDTLYAAGLLDPNTFYFVI